MKRIEGGHTVRADLEAVNPNYGKHADYNENCGNCVAAFEMRRRGYDVEANPRMAMPLKNWLDMFEGFKPLKPAADEGKAGVPDELTREIISWGEGARGTVYGVWDWRENYGHFFSVEVRDGKALFVDPQNGNEDAAWYFGKMKPGSIIYGRLDDLKPGTNISKACKEKEISQ
jgi:hypothetical protein